MAQKNSYSKNWQFIIFLFFLSSIVGFSYALFETGSAYQEGFDIATEFQVDKDLHIEIIRINAYDGTPIKGVLMSSDDNWNKQDNSVPLVILCHGIHFYPWDLRRIMYFLSENYTVFAPEFRGHGSNPAPSTLGSEEPWDIISFLDYFEEYSGNKFSSLNISNSGIMGISMGGLYATSAYYFESLGKGRLKSLVSIAGILNVSTAIENFSEDLIEFGDMVFFSNVTEKTPLNFNNLQDLKNVFIICGYNDNSAGHLDGRNFVDSIDPIGNRGDIQFYADFWTHKEICGGNKSYQKGKSWFDQYLLGETTYWADSEIIVPSFEPYYAHNFQIHLLEACIYLFIVIGSFTLWMKPEFFKIKNKKPEENIQFNGLNSSIIPIRISKYLPMRKTQIIMFYLMIHLLAGIIAIFLPFSVFNEFFLMIPFSMIYIYLMCRFLIPNGMKRIKNYINPKTEIFCLLIFIIPMLIYHIIPSIPLIEDNLLVEGIRISWWLPSLTAGLSMLTIMNIIFIRLLFDNPKIGSIAEGKAQKRERKIARMIEPFLNLILTFGMVISFYLWMIPIQLQDSSLILILALLIGLSGLLVDLIIQLFEKIGKTLFLGPVLLYFIIGLFIFSNDYVLIH